MKTYVFPGQGSQVKGMGATLFDEFAELTAKADEILGYSIKKLCLEDPDRELRLTQFTQPALYVVNALSYFKKIKETEEKPDYVAGHSLGEYNALLAAGAFDFETGLTLVKKRGELMSQASGGGMAAILGLTEAETRKILEENGLEQIDIANLNAPTQIVVSGLKDEIEKAQSFFENENVTYIPLNVSAAFHSRYMQEARNVFESYLKDFTFSELTIPVISNVTAGLYEQDDIVSNLAEQLRSSVKWSESVQYLLGQGEMEFEELGPGDVLTKLIDRIKTEAAPVSAAEESSSAKAEAGELREETQTNETNHAEAVVEELAAEADADENLSEDEAAGRAAYQKQIEEVQKRIAQWNKTHPVGTMVSCEGYDEELKTRTEAMMLFGHRAAIYIEGYNGYFALDEIAPV